MPGNATRARARGALDEVWSEPAVEVVPNMQKTQRIGCVGGARLACVPWLCAVIAAVCLSACGSADQSSTAAALLHRKPPAKKPIPAAADPTADMSAAVTTGRGPSPVNVKFQLGGRPQPGQPLTVELALIPDASVASVAAKFEGDGGLTLVSGDQVAEVSKLAPNVPIRHSVVVLPKSDGIYTLTATVTAMTNGDSRVRAFTIPVIAGEGLPALAGHSDGGKTHP